MAFYQSPGVYTKEIDLTGIIPGLSTTVGGHVGTFNWGPVNQPYQIADEATLVEVFGRPDDDTYNSFFTVSNFLSYSNYAMVVRAGSTTMRNANSADDADLVIRNSVHYDEVVLGPAVSGVTWAAKYPGARANGLRVSMADRHSFSKTLTGTVAVSVGSNVLTGTTTEFTTELAVGSLVSITVGGNTFDVKIVSITDDDTAITDRTFADAGTGLTVKARWEFADLFDYTPGTTEWVADNGGADDELHIVVVDELGTFTGTAGALLERYIGYSKAGNARRFDGSSNYYKTAMNRISKYVWWCSHPSAGAGASVDTTTRIAFGTEATPGVDPYYALRVPYTVQLLGGVDGSAGVTDADIRAGLDILGNDEVYDLSLLMMGKASSTLSNYAIQGIAEQRKDLVVFTSPFAISGDPIIGSTSAQIDEVIEYRNGVDSSSYGVIDTGVKYQYDRYNDTFRWVPLNGDVAGLCARTDYVADPWFSPGGFNRGRINNVVKLAVTPNQAQRDKLYPAGVNAIVSFPGEGPVLYGDKTLQRKPSAFDRINVRRLFITLRKTISTAAKYQLFEQNDEFTRAQFRAMVEPFLRDVKGRRGITDFRVVCDETNNPPDVVDRNEFRANIMVKPVRSINFIELTLTAVRSGVSFEEITGTDNNLNIGA